MNDGGPAWPFYSVDEKGIVSSGKGMSLLDYFAGQELKSYSMCNPCPFDVCSGAPDQKAKCAYLYGEAMIEERERRMKGEKS